MVFSRLDFENKGLRRTIEDRVNASLLVFDPLPPEVIDYSFEFQINAFCEEHNVDVDVAASYFLDALFERRNHLMTVWSDMSTHHNRLAPLLKLSKIASTNLGTYVDDKYYLSLQKDQTEMFYKSLPFLTLKTDNVTISASSVQ